MNTRDPERRASVTLGLLGCGTVGSSVMRLLAENAGDLEERVGAPLRVGKVLVRDVDKPRDWLEDSSLLTTDSAEVIDAPEIDLVVELMGGEEHALQLIQRALDAGKGVVTANKLLLATRGPELLERAVNARVDLAFEGAVGGGIPIVRALRDAFAGDRVQSITGILNGTSNYVLTRMLDQGLSMDEAIAEAQELGYAEADPSMDVGGHDAAHKLNILAMLGFGATVDPTLVPVEGIREIQPIDHRFAERFSYCIKHLVIGRDHGDEIELRVHPALIPTRSVLANVSGVLNAVLMEGQALGPSLVYGQGAGGLPTAVSVVSDIIDVARSVLAGVSGLQTRGIGHQVRKQRSADAIETRYYIRFSVSDAPGVMARLAGSLGDHGVSIEQMVQDGQPAVQGGPATVVMVTHRARESSVKQALLALEKEPFMVEPPHLLRIEDV